MTDRERQLASLGFEYAEGIESAKVITIPQTGRQIRKNKRGLWEVQPRNDNYWLEFADLIDAIKCGVTVPTENGNNGTKEEQ